MNSHPVYILLLLLTLNACQGQVEKKKSQQTVGGYDFVLAFGSCNNQRMDNPLWEPILENQPELFIWGGDIVYSDTEDMERMSQAYDLQKKDEAYKTFRKQVRVTGTWDDHDYGKNDGGAEYAMKDSVQQIFLDFFDVPSDSERRSRKGIYASEDIQVDTTSVKIILLDTRYFRTPLTKDPGGRKRYQPNTYGEGTMLGEEQWNWLRGELEDSRASFHVIVSSIQVLSGEHGFESWGNMPHEVDRLKQLLVENQVKGAILLSGDRHLAEISRFEIAGLNYPLIDFTSSGMTHSYASYRGESNPLRIVDVVSEKNFGLLKFDFANHRVVMEIRGEENKLLGQYEQKY